jgi:hypothetical protein
LIVPDNLKSARAKKAFKLEAMKYLVVGEVLFKRGSTLDSPATRVIDYKEARKEVIHALHNRFGHKGAENTFKLIRMRYFWEGMYQQVKKYVKGYTKCQQLDRRKIHEPLGTIQVNMVN